MISPATSAAQAVIASARRNIPGQAQPRPQLTETERRDAGEILKNGGACCFCAGIHAGDERACPRLATFELNGDGKVVSGSFWPQWDTSRTIYAEEALTGDGGA